MKSLTAPARCDDYACPQLYGADVNNDGTVLIQYNLFSRGFAHHSWTWTKGELTPLAGGYTWARDLNNTGDVVGSELDRPAVWRDGELHFLPLTSADVRLTDGIGTAMAINNDGVIGGQIRKSFGRTVPYAWWPNGAYGRLATLPDVPRTRDDQVIGIDRAGALYGRLGEWMVRWTERGQAVTKLGTFGALTAVTERGEVVGVMDQPAWNVAEAFAWAPPQGYDEPKKLPPLSDIEPTFAWPYAADRGISPLAPAGGVTVVGASRASNGRTHATVWTCALQNEVVSGS